MCWWHGIAGRRHEVYGADAHSDTLSFCSNFVIEYDPNFNTTKSVTTRIGPRFDVFWKSSELADKFLQLMNSVK